MGNHCVGRWVKQKVGIFSYMVRVSVRVLKNHRHIQALHLEPMLLRGLGSRGLVAFWGRMRLQGIFMLCDYHSKEP